MKQSKLVEMVEKVEDFALAGEKNKAKYEEYCDVFDLCGIIHENKNHDFEFVRTKGGWECRVMKINKKMDGKEIIYTKSFVFSEEEKTMVAAFKKAALRYLS